MIRERNREREKERADVQREKYVRIFQVQKYFISVVCLSLVLFCFTKTKVELAAINLVLNQVTQRFLNYCVFVCLLLK